ncbi:hypothetical protein ARALYDRAFT_914759 [Arabidopsis lyrata subsp. lyrata]|uniref:Uncharacterized protein n=1 Tax=Arabidopsis lyrata subsp. lyrata TaxID=81972 RepID=D7MGV8_ARALL|nr:defensin-like protein 140 [Arabidopsis lyrata subsp. lyrata]EFH44219.1 hypothetical protein ARALYDRAFT_914759 [Arabidopsis lyrata subsp. lyrata]|eukprot:XP_002867960.1 defensin-like protein 140 [Arabidopsis lyrata subsp. lyrata]
MSKSLQLIVTVLCIFTILVLGEIGMAKGQPLEKRCDEILTRGECELDICAFACALKRHGKGGCIEEAHDPRPNCVCNYTC